MVYVISLICQLPNLITFNLWKMRIHCLSCFGNHYSIHATFIHFFRNSKADASKFEANIEKMFPQYHIYSSVSCNGKSSTTMYYPCVKLLTFCIRVILWCLCCHLFKSHRKLPVHRKYFLQNFQIILKRMIENYL